MPAVSPSDFDGYFEALHARQPFHWQSQLAAQVCAAGGQWPDVIDLPTASGKTACLDIALFALACRDSAPRRLFFVVDRKVIVDEAYDRMGRIACALAAATTGILGDVASRLRELAGGPDALPLTTFQLRGGIYRDERWVRSPLQPTFVASTVDQIGSRLLFRGYGVSDSALPIHAGLISTDSLIFLDEAHCSKAFTATLSRIERYRGPAFHSIPAGQPLRFVEMTATPSRTASASFTLPPADREPEALLGRRLRTPKPTCLVPVRAKSDDYRKIAAELVKLARAAATDPETLRIAVIVNRVSTARYVYDELRKSANVELLTGRMRPVDRDDVVTRLAPIKSDADRPHGPEPLFVVATQCLEVGADLDFDALITECASIDALLQRFGRLDRLGEFGNARGWILLTNADPKKPDPVYGSSLAETRLWLEKLAGGSDTLDFALQAETSTVPQQWALADSDFRKTLIPKAAVTPALLPAHLDTLCQTSPRPEPEPEVSFFLHGSQPADADVQIVWRSDLDAAASPTNWLDTVKLIPPVVAEALPVKIWAFRKWIAGETEPLPQADVEGGEPEVDAASRRKAKPVRPFLIWRGERSVTDPEAAHVRPGDTIVIPSSYGGFDALGHVPDPTQPDVADRAFAKVRQRIRLRLHPQILPLSDDLKAAVRTESPEWDEIRALLSIYAASDSQLQPWDQAALQAFLENPLKRFNLFSYPGQSGWIIEQKPGKTGSFAEDGDADEASSGEPITLLQHTSHVTEAVRAHAAPLLESAHAEALAAAAHWHDTGKADPRFQALLLGGDPFAARFSPVLYAKGRFVPKSQSELHHQRSGLPKGFRHELASLTLAAQSIPPDANLRDLILHLIASHHGRCRPFAPIVQDPQPETFTVNNQSLTAADRLASPPHHLAAGVPDRFWSLIRTYGWWGLAYLEAILRLSDWSASAAEQRTAAEAREQQEEKEAAAQEPVHA
ncbi:MAG: type I-U CRISPR-associated helicase/endonuclease Cas3 [Bryobacterales bacterium]|nr:type I-U CRISPR-associated helicase/endonuclease Cas3 [Bryobacterales bacterium]